MDTTSSTDAIATPELVPARDSLWAVTGLAHPGLRDCSDDCEACLSLVEAAIADARATGSTGATVIEISGDAEHSATVAPAIRTYRTARGTPPVELARRLL